MPKTSAFSAAVALFASVRPSAVSSISVVRPSVGCGDRATSAAFSKRSTAFVTDVGCTCSSALVATDAVVSVVMGLVKVALFGSLDALDLELALVGLLVGLFTAPGAFLARAWLRHIPAGVHAGFMEAIVVAGAVVLLWQARE